MDELKIAIIFLVAQFLVWAIKTLVTKKLTKKTEETKRKKMEADRELVEAIADKTGAEALTILLENLNRSEEKRAEDSERISVLESKIKKQGVELDEVKSENEILRETVGKQETQISEIEKENKTLREMFLNEQLNTRTLKQGVRKLIAQLKERNIIPVFEIE